MSESPARPKITPGMVRPTLWMLFRLAASVVGLVGVYYVIPVRGAGDNSSDLPWLVLELVIFGAIVGVQVPLIVRARYPLMRGIEALALTVLLFLLIFARVYLSYSAGDPAVFNQPLDKDTALYFATTVFATVGFGDIVAASNPMKLLVTVQMLLNLVVFGLVIRMLTSATQRGMERKHGHKE